MDANETAVELLKLVAEDYSLDDVIEDYKKVMATIKGEVVVKSESVVLGKTGGRNVPIVKQHNDIKSRLTDSIAATAGSAVTSNLAQF